MTPYPCVDHGVTLSMYYADPDEMLAMIGSGTPGSAFLVRPSDLPVSPIRGALSN